MGQQTSEERTGITEIPADLQGAHRPEPADLRGSHRLYSTHDAYTVANVLILWGRMWSIQCATRSLWDTNRGLVNAVMTDTAMAIGKT